MRLHLLLFLICGALAINTSSAQERLGGRVHDGHTATADPLVDVIQDGGFEDGTPNGFWDESSTNFGTPLCDAGCGTGAGTGPHSGFWWTWFGGIAAYEEGSVSQDVTLSAGTATLTFWLEVPVCDSDQDYLEVTVDGTQVFMIDGADPSCNTVGYTQQTVNLDTYADGGTHTIAFHSEIFGLNGSGSNFFIDDVALDNVGTAIELGPDGQPGTHALTNVYPNPFRGQARFTLEVAETQDVRIEVLNVLGQRVATLHDGALSAGAEHPFTLEASGLASGVYVVRATGETFSDVRTVTITR